MINKAKVREDYINGMSVRALADKYHVPKSTIGDWVQRYGWLREKPCTITMKHVSELSDIAKSMDESDTSDIEVPELSESDAVTDEQSYTDYLLLRRYAMKILAKANQILELDDALAPRDLKSMTGMMLDVKVLLGASTPTEAKEQEARLQQMNVGTSKEPVVIRFVDLNGSEK